MKFLERKKVLLTGAGGFVGSHLADNLRFIPGLELTTLKRGELPGRKNDIVFHLAAFTPKTGSSANDVRRTYEDNLVYTRWLMQQLADKQPDKFIFASTLDVYAPTQLVIDESSHLGPTNLYGSSKLFCEEIVKDYCSMWNIPLSTLRYGNIYGPGEEAYRKLIPETIRTLLSNESPIIFGDGSTGRDFVFIKDVVEATLRASNLTKSEVLNIVSGQSKSIKEYVEIIITLTQLPREIHYLPGLNADSRAFNNAKMFKVLGKWELTSLQIGLLEEFNYFKSLMEVSY